MEIFKFVSIVSLGKEDYCTNDYGFEIFGSTNLQMSKVFSIQSTGFTSLNTYLQSTRFLIKTL